MRHRFLFPGLASGLVAALAMGLSTIPTQAEEAIQTGDGLLMIRAAMPETTRVGEQFTYEIEVVNASDNVVLHNIQLNQSKAKGFSVDSVSQQDSKSDQGNDEKNQSAEKPSSSKSGMTIEKLAPGQSRTLVVKATADEEGELRTCLEIESYTPALCLTSKIVKPELELTKSAPKKANRCDVIELEYTLKNGGSGDVGAITITDSLGEGLATIDGESDLSFQVDGLKAGDTRKFVARVYAEKPGEFVSRAVAQADDSKLTSRSKETTTQVIAAELEAKVDGPSRIYGGQLATFNATITNTGNVAADNVQVNVAWPAGANLADFGDWKLVSNEDRSNKGQQGEKSQGNKQAAKKDRHADHEDSLKENRKQPTLAKSDVPGNTKEQDPARNQQDASRSLRDEMQHKSFKIDQLAPGETVEFSYAIRTADLETLPTRVEAVYVCTVDDADETSKTTSMAMAEAKIVRLPALQLVVIDDEDPVADGSKVTYRVRVWNEGDAPDSNVKLTVKLPEGLKFDDADGPTEHQADGNTVSFKPIETLEAGARVDYVVIAKPTGEGNVRVQASITSESLDQEVTSEEPTRLFASASQ